MMTKMLEDEYAKFSEAERDGWAYNNTYDSNGYHLTRFMEALDINAFPSLIDK